jgi:hypothetical protein
MATPKLFFFWPKKKQCQQLFSIVKDKVKCKNQIQLISIQLPLLIRFVVTRIDHGRLDELGSGKKLHVLKKLQSSSIVFQNDLAFLWRIGKASLSEFPETFPRTAN